MIFVERELMDRRQKWDQMSEGEGKERREQQRLWYRRRRAQMTEEEISYQNERRRMRYRQKRLMASAERTARSAYEFIHPSPAMEGGENSRSNSEEVLRNLHAKSTTQTTRGSLDPHDFQQELDGNGEPRRHQWRWKVEARRGKSDKSFAKFSAIAGEEDAQSDDSETTETDESIQGVLSPSYFASFATSRRKSDDELAISQNEVTSEAQPKESTVQRTVRLTQMKHQARAQFLQALADGHASRLESLQGLGSCVRQMDEDIRQASIVDYTWNSSGSRNPGTGIMPI